MYKYIYEYMCVICAMCFVCCTCMARRVDMSEDWLSVTAAAG